MSFSKEVKEELSNRIPKSKQIQLAELAAMISFGIKEREYSENQQLNITFTEDFVARKFFTLLKKTLNINSDVTECDAQITKELLKVLHISKDFAFEKQIIEQFACKQSFIRGAFLVSGSVSDPNKSYHLEIVSHYKELAEILVEAINSFDAEAKIVVRNGRYVVYIKDGSQIVEVLRVMEASHSVMKIENIRVVKEVRESVNRKYNCDIANIKKTVNASVRQIEDIRLLDSNRGLSNLPAALQQIAYLRLENPDISLQALGELMDPPLGKSGVNHRLKKLSALADNYRDG